MASKKFVDDFDLVSRYYRLKEMGEYEEAKRCARGDMDNAEISFAAMAKDIRVEQSMSTRCVDIPLQKKGSEAIRLIRDILKSK